MPDSLLKRPHYLEENAFLICLSMKDNMNKQRCKLQWCLRSFQIHTLSSTSFYLNFIVYIFEVTTPNMFPETPKVKNKIKKNDWQTMNVEPVVI